MTEPTGEQSQVRDFDHLLALLNHVLTTAPGWSDAGHKAGLVGVPINALLDWPMGTKGGFTVFQDPTVNAHVSRPFWGGGGEFCTRLEEWNGNDSEIEEEGRRPGSD